MILPNSKDLMKSVGLDEGGKVQKYIDNFVKEQSAEYIPFKTGTLISSSSSASQNGSGLVIWNTDYANYMYEGKLMVSPSTGSAWAKKYEQKVYTSPTKRLFEENTQRREHWFDRMIDDKMDDLLNGVQNIVDGGSK